MIRFVLLLLLIPFCVEAQILKIKDRNATALSGSAFAKSISDTLITPEEREKRIYTEVLSGNIPESYRTLVAITDTVPTANGKPSIVQFSVLPDYLAIGSDADYFYVPLTPAMAQRIANKLQCSLPTRVMVDKIYRKAQIKLEPKPIPPSKVMTTVPVFIRHNQMVINQRDSVYGNLTAGKLVAGNKKDVIISNRIYNDTSSFHVVIYGWHKPDGKPIQPVYARHLASWADYSHGIRLIQDKIWVDGKETSLKKLLKRGVIFTDEGKIKKPYYPTQLNYTE